MAHVVVATLHQFALAGDISPKVVVDAIQQYGIDPESASSLHT
jgi:pyruvate dehydrogenase complex dehydrogenase (E1) component